MPLDSWTTRVEPSAPSRARTNPGFDADNPEIDNTTPVQPVDTPPIETIGQVDDPVGLAADTAFAELSAKAALEAEIESLRLVRQRVNDAAPPAQRQTAEPTESISPAGRVDWSPEIVQSGRALHALLGLDDPLSDSANSSFDESAIDLELQAALRQLPETSLETGELAALDAFDMALGQGADMEEALSAAIAAAEALGNPEWTEPTEDAFLGPTPSLTSSLTTPTDQQQADTPRAPRFELAGDPASDAVERADAANPQFGVRIDSAGRGVANGLPVGLGSGDLDPAFAFGFDFGADLINVDAPSGPLLDFERRLIIERDRNRDDVVTSAAASTVNDVIGSIGADLLVGGNAQDAVGGLAGDDYLYGDTPTNFDSATHDASSPLTNPIFNSGDGDVISGGAGADSLWGGAGDDQLHGDIPDAGTSLAAEFGFDLGTAGFGDDALWGGDGADSLWGGGGNDTLRGEAGNDSLIGGSGNDLLYGGDGDDRLEGDAGIDTLYGDAGSDNLFGYAGDDIIIGGGADDTLAGGNGADEFRFAGGTGADALAHAQDLGTDTVSDYSAADGDTFGLSDADFGFGNTGNLVAGDTYFEFNSTALSATPLDASSGDAGPAVVVFGANSGTDGVDIYYTDDASAMTNANSYQIADVIGVNMTDVEAGDFFLWS